MLKTDPSFRFEERTDFLSKCVFNSLLLHETHLQEACEICDGSES